MLERTRMRLALAATALATVFVSSGVSAALEEGVDKFYGISTLGWMLTLCGVIAFAFGAYMKHIQIIVIGIVLLIGVAVLSYLGM